MRLIERRYSVNWLAFKSEAEIAAITPALQPRTFVLPVDKVVDKLCAFIVGDNLIKWRNRGSF